jgi:thiamine biosynthesis lipoprotein
MKKNLFIFILLLLVGCGKIEQKKIVERKFAFGTMIDMVVYSENSARAKKAMDLAFKEIERVDNKFNTHKEDSLIYKLNHTPGKFFKLDREGIYLFSSVKQTYNLSKTKYDITIAPLMEIWGFSDKENSDKLEIPKKDELKKAILMVDYSNLEILGDKIRLKTSKNKIDTGSFLKGYAIHRAKTILAENGVKHAFISAISSIETLNTKPEGEYWKVGLQNPEDPSEIYHIIEINNKSMGVSGDYQIYVEIEGKKYHHLLDRETGYPVRDRKMVVVIGKNGFFADMYSTAFFSMPIEDVMNYVNSKDDLEVMIVKADMSEVYSNGFKKYIIK